MDLNHQWGSDLNLSASGGLSLVDGTEWGTQKVIRRLMTNPGDDKYHSSYGAGLPAFIGSTATQGTIKATILKQMRLESAVSQTTPPSVNVFGSDGNTYADISYVDAATNSTVSLSSINVS